jgi:hypothetical protein
MNALDLTAAAFSVSGLINFSTRPAVIRLLHRMGVFEPLGAPRTFFYSDALPLRVVFLPFRTASDKALAALYLASWLLFIGFGIASIALLLSRPQSA